MRANASSRRLAALLGAALSACAADEASTPTVNPATTSTGCHDAVCLTLGHCEDGHASAQFRAQTTLPATASPSARLPMSVTFTNCSGVAWSPQGFSLAPVFPDEGSAWGVLRVPLPAWVPNGVQVTFNFGLQAPLATGTYTSRWAISRDGVELFEDHTPTQVVQVLAQADCSATGAPIRFRSQAAPPEFLGVGDHFHTRITFANCSPSALTTADGWALGSATDPADTWGRRAVPLPGDVPSGAETTFELDLVAPSTPGTYRYAWHVQQGDAAVGESSPLATPTVLVPAQCEGARPAQFVRQTAPSDVLDPDQPIDVAVTYGNCSGTTWDASFALDTALPGDARPWSAGPVSLPLRVGSGYQIDVPFRVRAPHTPGRYGYRWAVRGPAGALDEPTPALERTVRCIPQCGDHNCGGDGCGGSCGGCPGGWSCDGAHCQSPDLPQCGVLQWWNSYLTYEHLSGGWHDTDLGVRGSTPVQLRHRSRLDRYGVYGWGYMPEFTDLDTGYRFRMLHLRPQNMYATEVGRVYEAGYVVGLSGGDTYDTGLPVYSTGAHLCIQTLTPYFDVFPRGSDACR